MKKDLDKQWTWIYQEHKKKAKEIKEKVIDKLITFITSAFGFVAALSWNNAVKNLFDTKYPPGQGIGALFIYALVVTMIAVSIIILLEKVLLYLKGEKNDK